MVLAPTAAQAIVSGTENTLEVCELPAEESNEESETENKEGSELDFALFSAQNVEGETNKCRAERKLLKKSFHLGIQSEIFTPPPE